MKTELERQFQPLLSECDKLRLLILQPEPGLATWHMMIRDRLICLRHELNKLLPDENQKLIESMGEKLEYLTRFPVALRNPGFRDEVMAVLAKAEGKAVQS